MKKVFSVLYALFIICSIAIAQTTKDKIAVYVTGDAQTGYKKVVGSKIVTAITKSDNYSAVERTSDFLAELAKEQEYQMSGAVSDNQIVKLGQQFGVRFVLVAEVSEVFESIFISARMINVQTGQITNSAEADAIVESLDGLTSLSEKVITMLLYGKLIDKYKIIGPFNYAGQLCHIDIDEGYRIANKDEVINYIKKQQLLGLTLSLPVYVDIKKSELPQTDYFTISEYTYRGSKKIVNNRLSERYYTQYKIEGDLIMEDFSNKHFQTYYCNDESYFDYLFDYSILYDDVTGLQNGSVNYEIESGFIYLIRVE